MSDRIFWQLLPISPSHFQLCFQSTSNSFYQIINFCLSSVTKESVVVFYPWSPDLLYRWWQLPYYWVGIKAYDFVAGRKCVKSSYILSKEKALELFPMLRKDKLVGALVYYDGMFQDGFDGGVEN